MQSEVEKPKLSVFYPVLDDLAHANFDVMLGRYPDKNDNRFKVIKESYKPTLL